MNDLVEYSFNLNVLFLGGVSIYSAERAINSKQPLSNSIACLINVIAFIQHNNMRIIWKHDHREISLYRYIDWIITCPLLLYEFLLLKKWIKKEYEVIIAISMISTVLMIMFGYLSETITKYRWKFYILATISLLIVYSCLLYIYNNEKKRGSYNCENDWAWIFIGIWAFYGISYLLPKNIKNISYNILDLISKGIFAILIGINSENK